MAPEETKTYVPCKDFYSEILEKEREWIKTRRGSSPSDPLPEKLVGLALSGGGIRSASYNLGIVSGLYHYGLLKHVDYLSTVSGGSYVGACLTWFGSVLKKKFPLMWLNRKDANEQRGVRQRLQYLRARASYLIPGDGLNLWSLMAAILAGTLTTLTVLLPVIFALVSLLSEELLGQKLFYWIAMTGLFCLIVFVVLVLLYAVFSNYPRFRKATSQRGFREFMGNLLTYGALLTATGYLPELYTWVKLAAPDIWEWVFTGITFSGVLSILGGLRSTSEGKEVRPLPSVALTIGLLLIVYGLLLWIYHIEQEPGLQMPWYLLLVSFIVAVWGNINHVSMHRFYRNRLMEAFMPADKKQPEMNPDTCRLESIPPTDFPYHIINTNVQTVGSSQSRLRLRGGDSFILSPKYCGSCSTGYIQTSDYVGGNMNLATAMAVSGAAADTNSYATRSRPLVFLMTLFNVRLGYWIQNPKSSSTQNKKYISRFTRFVQPMWYWYLLREILGRGMNEKSWFVRLSDGGHFENLGLYELVRRRCKLIIVSDASRDPEFKFADLGRAVEYVRADFGALVDIDLEEIQPDEKGISKSAIAIGKIFYPPLDGVKEKYGTLIYIKSNRLKNAKPDVVAYEKQNEDFPDQSTADQFFDELQFEAYRELGIKVIKILATSDEERAEEARELIRNGGERLDSPVKT
jgi:hypothetical protein